MFDSIIAILIFIIIILVVNILIETFINYWKVNYGHGKCIVSKIDNVCRKVVQKFPNPQGAADTISRLDNFAREYIDMMQKFDKPGVDAKYVKVATRLRELYNSETILENIKKDETSYTVNKGEKMFLCVRDKYDGNILDDFNTLKFVLIHELAHIATEDFEPHSTEFWQVFKFMLKEAVKANMYTPVDYSKKPVKYCGMDVTNSPLFNSAIISI